MTVAEIQVDQRVIGIDSRRFASVEKALVELITNSDDSYARLEKAGASVTGRIQVGYERHHAGAVLMVSDEAEGMSFEQAARILSYGGAHSPLARGEGAGRGYFGRGLKQAIFGLGHGWIETIQNGRFTRIDVFRGENGGYLYDDGGADRRAFPADYARLGIPAGGIVDAGADRTDGAAGNGTRVTIVVDNPQVTITQHATLLRSLSDNIYLRDILDRREVELVHGRPGVEDYGSENIRFQEPPATVLLGPDQQGSFSFDGEEFPFAVTLKRAQEDVELALKGDERTAGLIVESGMAVLDCQLFEYENQVGTEYLFGTVRCPTLTEMLGRGKAIISDEREGLNIKDPFVAAFSRAVSRMIADAVQDEKEKLTHLERATTSGRTADMIEHLLQHMSEAAVVDLGLETGPPPGNGGGSAAAPPPAALRFTTPFYYRPPGRPFHVALLLDPGQLPDAGTLTFELALPASLRIDPAPAPFPVGALGDTRRIEWTMAGDREGDHGEITVRAGDYWALCEIVIAEHASRRSDNQPPHHTIATDDSAQRAAQREVRRPSRDHGVDLFIGYDFRTLHHSADRAVYDPTERKVIINTGAPTVQLYVDGRGRFRDSARLLLAELFLRRYGVTACCGWLRAGASLTQIRGLPDRSPCPAYPTCVGRPRCSLSVRVLGWMCTPVLSLRRRSTV